MLLILFNFRRGGFAFFFFYSGEIIKMKGSLAELLKAKAEATVSRTSWSKSQFFYFPDSSLTKHEGHQLFTYFIHLKK